MLARSSRQKWKECGLSEAELKEQQDRLFASAKARMTGETDTSSSIVASTEQQR